MLEHLTRSNYELWSLARNPDTGLYLANVDVTREDLTQQDWEFGDVGVTGLGLIAECIAHKLGWISDYEVKTRVLVSLE